MYLKMTEGVSGRKYEKNPRYQEEEGVAERNQRKNPKKKRDRGRISKKS